MYEQFFHFRRRPFPAAPSLRHYVSLQTMEEHRAKLVRCLARGEGVGLLVGPTGTGKTLLCRAVGANLNAHCEVVMPAVGRVASRKALFQAVLFELRRPYQGMDDGELRLALMDYLLSEDREKPLVLIIDEADTLSLRILDELRLLLNLGKGEEPPLRLLLSGGTLLEEKLAAAKLQPLSQRIAARCYLDALSRAESFTYVREQIRLCGGNPDAMLSEETLAAVYHATGGVPRLINQICDHALLLAFADEVEQISPELVQEAWSDLQQLPMPWEPVPGPKSGPSQVVEFGAWEDTSTTDSPSEDLGQDLRAAAADGTRMPDDDRPVGENLPAPEEAAETGEEAARSDGGRRFHGPGPMVNGPSGAFPVPSGEADCGQAIPEPVEIRPLEHIQQAENALRQLQQEFRPPATKTEVELIFDDWGNPFEEEFQQVIPVTGGTVRETAPQAQGDRPWTRTFPDQETEKKSANRGSLELVIATEDDATVPTVRATPLGEDRPSDSIPEDTGTAEVLIFDAHPGTARSKADGENSRRETGREVRTPKFRRLFSQLKQRIAEGQET